VTRVAFSKTFRWRALLVIAALAAGVFLAVSRPVRLGLDLRGGTQIVLEAQDTPSQVVDDDTASRTLEVLRRRVDALGVSEPTLQRSGDRRVIVELPGVADPEEALAVIGRTAQLSFHPVLGVELPPTVPSEQTTTTTTPAGAVVLPAEDGSLLRLGPAVLTGEAVADAGATFGNGGGQWAVEIEFQGEGGAQFAALTADAACLVPGDPGRRVAIALDDEVISSPEVATSVPCGTGITGGTTVITGQDSETEARDLALLIRAGALPVPVEVIEQRSVGPTLGESAIRASVQAALIGASLTILYMIVAYRLLGALAAVGLAVYGLLSFAVLLALDATLTLPGIAGFVLAIGMAVDANVLVFERAKEEHAAGRSPRLAATRGFSRAWSAIADSNATTLLAAVLLFFFASGAVRGFGITLSVGVVVSMFSSLVVTRVLVELALRHRGLVRNPKALGLVTSGRLRPWLAERGPALLRRSRLWLTCSALALALAVAGIALRGLSLGLEFSGGRLVEYATEQPVDPETLRSELVTAGLPRAVVQASGDDNVTIRSADLGQADEARIEEVVDRLGSGAEILREEFVGPTIGDELRNKALIALSVALAAQLAYLAVRFRWTFGAAAVAAMAHDVVILLGVFAWLGKDLDGVFLAALLTVIGYSINDTVVVFDRVREQRRSRTGDDLATVANDACLQTIPRTINTGLGALFILVALYVLGGDTLTDFALALMVGIVVGTYSSIFTATPVMVALEKRRREPASPPPTESRPKVNA
jgi:SecD/SecF fusion protein